MRLWRNGKKLLEKIHCFSTGLSTNPDVGFRAGAGPYLGVSNANN
jgi:hypothetical protein